MIPLPSSILLKIGAAFAAASILTLTALLMAQKAQTAHYKSSYEAQIVLNSNLEADIAIKTAEATAAATLKAEQDRLAYERIQTENTNALEDRLSMALASARDYRARLERLRIDFHPPGGSGPGDPADPAPAGPASGPHRTPSDALVPVPAADLDACAVAYVTATGWQAWWQQVRQVQQANQDAKK